MEIRENTLENFSLRNGKQKKAKESLLCFLWGVGWGVQEGCEYLPGPETKVSLRKRDFKRCKNGVGKAFGQPVKRKKLQVCSFTIHVLTHSKLLDTLKDTEVNQNNDLRVCKWK